jgi:hypothetical protein
MSDRLAGPFGSGKGRGVPKRRGGLSWRAAIASPSARLPLSSGDPSHRDGTGRTVVGSPWRPSGSPGSAAANRVSEGRCLRNRSVTPSSPMLRAYLTDWEAYGKRSCKETGRGEPWWVTVAPSSRQYADGASPSSPRSPFGCRTGADWTLHDVPRRRLAVHRHRPTPSTMKPSNAGHDDHRRTQQGRLGRGRVHPVSPGARLGTATTLPDASSAPRARPHPVQRRSGQPSHLYGQPGDFPLHRRHALKKLGNADRCRTQQGRPGRGHVHNRLWNSPLAGLFSYPRRNPRRSLA